METQPLIDLNQFRGGTNQYHRHWLNGIYTDGMKHIADECGAYWLMDLVFSHRGTLAKRITLRDFPVKITLEQWKTKAKPHGAKCIAEHYNSRGEPIPFTLQTVEYTDFPFDRFKDNRFSFLLGYDSGKLILSLSQEN